MKFSIGVCLAAVLGSCGGKSQAPAPTPEAPPAEEPPAQEEPAKDLKAGTPWENWDSFTNVSPGAWASPTHGKRFVEIYVNDVGLEAYKSGAEMPVGSIVVKPSWENEGGKPGADGPLFVMEKKEAGFAPDVGDWFYAFQWASPTEKFSKLGKNVDWRSPSEKVEYCSDCHDAYDRALGLPPEERRGDW